MNFAPIVNAWWSHTTIIGLVLLSTATGSAQGQVRSNRFAIEPAPLPPMVVSPVVSNVAVVTNTPPITQRITQSSVFIADRCPFCLRKNVKSKNVSVMQSWEMPSGALKLSWVIDYTCPSCKHQFRDSRISYTPKLESKQIK
jgi:hypothetical protein